MNTDRNAEYEIKLHKLALKDLDNLSITNNSRINNVIAKLAYDPRPRGVKKLKDDILFISLSKSPIPQS